ncbi:hypothetical protein A2159_01725 [Candidatus Woesebacteria bacterium RBG_13_34_9]|uniref:Type IV pilus modification protein PilV n=1 Tax=Candidatus Woesebacteria bacterium RBG_13_34_9 TaxID=1802477 RepID=A0A1F7X2D5_9BACT|nr:MAG: hypothetical protein A2159_01725 [Candidatus Woesebacteria bacterium RBG_13_34_9]
MINKKLNQGQSLFELVVAISVIALILMGIVSVAAVSVRNSSFSRNSTIANKYAQEATEWLRQQRDSNWSVFSTHSDSSGITTCLGSEPLNAWGNCSAISGIFYRQVTLTTDAADINIINSEVLVTWTDSQGDHEINDTTIFTYWNK